MSKGNTFENELLEHILNNANIPLIGDAAGLLASAADGSLYVSLHTADPGETGAQNTSECTYTDYAREAIARDGTGWTVTANSASPQANIDFTIASAGTETATHWMVGTASSGTGKQIYRGTISPNIAISVGVTPRLTTASTITEE